MIQNIVIIGSSGHAKVVADVVEKEAKFKIAGLIDDIRDTCDDAFGYRILGRQVDMPKLISEHALVGGIIAVGDNWLRAEVAGNVAKSCAGFAFVSTVHPSANIARGASWGEGSVIVAGATLGPDCRVGRFCILNTSCSLDHDSVMSDFSSLAPGANIGGSVNIGAFSAIGIGAKIVHGIRIGEHAVVGAGSTVLEDIASYKVAYGTPARVIRDRKEGDKYL